MPSKGTKRLMTKDVFYNPRIQRLILKGKLTKGKPNKQDKETLSPSTLGIIDEMSNDIRVNTIFDKMYISEF